MNKQLANAIQDQLCTICDSKAYSNSVLDAIKSEIEKVADEEADCPEWSRGLRYSLKIIDKYIGGNANEQKPQHKINA